MPAPLPAGDSSASNIAAGDEDVFYPSSDGKPMAENMWQADVILYATIELRSARPDALVAPAILMYPERGNNRNRISPDVLVALGIGTDNRWNYLVWKEGKPPDWVLEVAAPGKEKDRICKRRRYAAMGVPEYWMFDPKGDAYPRGTPRLQGFELVDGAYQPLEPRPAAGGRRERRMIRSKVLGLGIRTDGALLRFRDPATGRDFRHPAEHWAAVKRAEAGATREAAQPQTSEARAEREAAQRQTAEARAEREAAARATAEARVAELEAALRRSRTDHSM